MAATRVREEELETDGGDLERGQIGPGSNNELSDVRAELLRVEAAEQLLASKIGTMSVAGSTHRTRPLTLADGDRPNNPFRSIDPEAEVSTRLEEAHERLASLQIDAAILEARAIQRRRRRWTALAWVLPVLAPLCIGFLVPELLLASVLLYALGILIYWLVIRIEPKPGDAPRARFPGSRG